MNKNHLIVAAVLVVIAGGGGYWAGLQHVGGRGAAGARFGQGATNVQFAGRAGQGSMGAAFGTIIAKDAGSITVELGGPNASSTNGTSTGSKLVLFDGSTQIGKFTSGSTNDLSVGESVSVAGTPNSDGSITAQSIQIRPAGMSMGGRPSGF